MSLIQQRIEAVTLGEPTIHGQMALFPLLDSSESGSEYIIMDDAITGGCAQVTEVDEGGSVPELAFKNGCEQRVFLMEGEELVGAKQNRTLNISIMVPAGKEIAIPVTCVESGRWSYDSPTFMRSERAHFAKGRRSKMGSVSRHMAYEGRPRADQGEVWDRISEKARMMRSQSPTSAMGDIFETHKESVEDYVKAFTVVENQAGMLVMVGNDIVGLDLFDSTGTLKKLMPKLVRSFALDAIEITTKKPYQPKGEDAEELLKKAASANTTTHKGAGDGENIRLQGEDVVGGALVVDEKVIHLSVFRNDEQSESHRHDRGSRMRRASHRRTHRRSSGAEREGRPAEDDGYDVPSFLRTEAQRDQDDEK